MNKQDIAAVTELRDCVAELATLVKEASSFISEYSDTNDISDNEIKYIDLQELTELVNKL